MEFLWDQWVALGMAGHASGGAVPFVVDPEALLLATLRYAMNDGRFRGETLDWLSQNGGLVSVQRLKNLDRAMPIAPPEHLLAVSAYMRAAGFPNWKALTSRTASSEAEKFPETRGRGMSQAPDPVMPEAFILRMRQVLGVSARAEVITWLLTHSGGHAAGIARETGWFSKSVQGILNDFEQAGMLVARTEGKRKQYSPDARAHLWHPDLGKGLRWFPQGMFYVGVEHVLRTVGAASGTGLSAAARAIEIRRNLVPLETAFRLAGLDELYAGVSREKGESLIARFEAGTEMLLQQLEERTFRVK